MNEYGKINLDTLIPPNNRYIIHVIDKREFVRGSENLEFYPNNTSNNLTNIYEYHNITYIDNYGQPYRFTTRSDYHIGKVYMIGENEKNIHTSNDLYVSYPSGDLSKYLLVPDNTKYKYKLSDKLIDFVKSQTNRIKNLEILGKLKVITE